MLQKWLVLGTVIVAAPIAFLFLMDLAIKFPFQRANPLADILFILGAAAVLSQAYETYREVA